MAAATSCATSRCQVPPGSLTVFLGRNGVGKTTLMRCLMGVVRAKSGTITWGGEPLDSLGTPARVARGIAYVPQGRDIFGRLTVEENLLVGAASKRGVSQVPERIYRLFPVLKDMLQTPRRRFVGRPTTATRNRSSADERAAALDSRRADRRHSAVHHQEIGRTLRKLVDETGMTVLLVEQYYEFAKALADHYWVMRRGEIVASGAGRDMDASGVREMIAV